MIRDRKDALSQIKGSRVLVTGGTGFIGSHLVEVLKDYCDVTVLSLVRKVAGVTMVNVNLRDGAGVAEKIADLDFDVVFHTGGNVRVPGKDAAGDHFGINAEGTKNLLEACKKKGLKRFVYSSSMSVFGDALYLPVEERHPKLPSSFYGASKLLGEHYCQEYRRFYGVNTVILRYSHVYGARQYEGRVCSAFINNALNGEPLKVFGSGRRKCDFVYVKDVVSANILAACEDSVIGEDFNIGCGAVYALEDLAHTIKGILPNVDIVHIDEGSKTGTDFVFDISKARSILGYEPDYTLIEGLLEQIEYAKQLVALCRKGGN